MEPGQEKNVSFWAQGWTSFGVWEHLGNFLGELTALKRFDNEECVKKFAIVLHFGQDYSDKDTDDFLDENEASMANMLTDLDVTFTY